MTAIFGDCPLRQGKDEKRNAVTFQICKDKTWYFTCPKKKLMARIYFMGEVLLPIEGTVTFLLEDRIYFIVPRIF